MIQLLFDILKFSVMKMRMESIAHEKQQMNGFCHPLPPPLLLLWGPVYDIRFVEYSKSLLKLMTIFDILK